MDWFWAEAIRESMAESDRVAIMRSTEGQLEAAAKAYTYREKRTEEVFKAIDHGPKLRFLKPATRAENPETKDVTIKDLARIYNIETRALRSMLRTKLHLKSANRAYHWRSDDPELAIIRDYLDRRVAE